MVHVTGLSCHTCQSFTHNKYCKHMERTQAARQENKFDYSNSNTNNLLLARLICLSVWIL